MYFRILLIFMFVTSLAAEPVIIINYKYYSLNTKSVNNLLSDINRSTPIKENNQIFHGHTDSYINWKFRWKITNGKCLIEDVSTNVDITYILPKLTNREKSHELLKLWEKWYPALVKHENKHAAHAVTIANKIEYEIINLPFRYNCKELENDANKTGNKLIKKLNELDLIYDNKTQHGKSEGANLSTHL